MNLVKLIFILFFYKMIEGAGMETVDKYNKRLNVENLKNNFIKDKYSDVKTYCVSKNVLNKRIKRETQYDINELREQIKLLETPFKWIKYDEITSKHIIQKIKEKLEEIIENTIFKFRNFISQIILVYEYYHILNLPDQHSNFTSNYRYIMEKINTCENNLLYLKHINCSEPLFLDAYESLLHVNLGCKAYIFMELNKTFKSRKVLQKIVGLSNMTTYQKAAIYGIRAAVLAEYGPNNYEEALKCSLKARELDPLIAEWNFIIGNQMARIRRLKYLDFDEKEIFFLEKAVQLSDNERYKLHLAQSYREKGRNIFYLLKEKDSYYLRQKLYKLNYKCYSIYRNLTKQHQDNPRLLGRCAFGISKLPFPFKKISLVVKTINKAVLLAPNNIMINHFAGLIYYRYTDKLGKAIQFMERAYNRGMLGAGIDVVKLKYIENPKKYNPLPDLENIAKKCVGEDTYYSALAQLGSYYFFNLNNIIKAWVYIKKIITEKPDHRNLKYFFPATLFVDKPFNLCEVMLDEIKLNLNKKTSGTVNQEKKLIKICIHLQRLFPDHDDIYGKNLKGKIKSKSKKLLMEYKEKKRDILYNRFNNEDNDYKSMITESSDISKNEYAYSSETYDTSISTMSSYL